MNVENSTQSSLIDIEILQGKITRIGRNLSNRAVRNFDVAGSYVAPGLFDAHVHLRAVPGSEFRQDSERQYWDLFDVHMGAYLSAGVTSVLDAATPEDLMEKVDGNKKIGKPMPRVFFRELELAKR